MGKSFLACGPGIVIRNRHNQLPPAGLAQSPDPPSVRPPWFRGCQKLRNVLFKFRDQGMVLNDPVFGFRRIGLGPVPQCIDTGVVVFGQGDKLRILRHEEIDAIVFVRKPLSNVMGHIIHGSFS